MFNVKSLQKNLILQKSQSDCGVACLASISKYYNKDVNLEKLRELSGTNKKGTTLLGLYDAAEKIGFISNAYEANIEDLIKIKNPCILHVVLDNKFNHYVVFYGLTKNKFLIGDPSFGIKKLEKEELNQIWKSKTVLVLEKSSNFSANEPKSGKEWFWLRKIIQSDLKLLVVAFLLGALLAIMGLSTAFFSQLLIDEIIPSGSYSNLLIGCTLLFLVLSMQALIAYLRSVILFNQSKNFNTKIISFFFDKLLKLPIRYFLNRSTGDVLVRLNDTSRIQSVVTNLFANSLIEILIVIFSLFYVFYYSLLLGLILLLSVPSFLVLSKIYHQSIVNGQKKTMQADSNNESNYVETIKGIETIVNFSKQNAFLTQVNNKFYAFQSEILDLRIISSKFGFTTQMIGNFFNATIFLLASIYVLNGNIDIGVMVAIFQLSFQIIPSVRNLSLLNIKIQEARVAYDRVNEFISHKKNTSVEVITHSKSDILEVNFENLSFNFPGQLSFLKDISFLIERNKITTFFGESGSGKSTLLKIIQRYYLPSKGNIVVNDNININEIPLEFWRDKIGLVPQSINLFSGTLFENISLAIDTDSKEKVIEFCKKLGFDKYFSLFPQGYATLLGESGFEISGGQKQLVAITRALYHEPDVILLDEPTSAMHLEMEKMVWKTFHNLKNKMAIVLVTHRINSAKHSDIIHIIKDGSISHSDTPKNLLSTRNNLFYDSIDNLNI